MNASRNVAAVFASMVVAGYASAGILDSPPPTFDGGAPGKAVYRMGPVYSDPGKVDTLVQCTNIADGPTAIALEVFDEGDTRVGGIARASLPASGSVTFVTSAAIEIAGAVVIPELPTIDHGKARVSATSSKLSCTALLRMQSEDGTSKEAPLELVKKVAYD
jgi:hypothetical protein